MIIRKISDKNPKDKNGNTPLHEAAKSGQLRICELLTNNINDVNPKNNEGTMPLHLAAKSGHVEICNLLLMTTQQPNPMNNLRTPLHYAAENGHLKTYVLLIQRYANLNIKGKEGLMPTELACKKGHFEENQMLNSQGTNALREAVLKGDLKVFDTLMKLF